VSATRRREQAAKREAWLIELRQERAMQRFFIDGTIPADAQAVSICSCGARAFTFAADDYDFAREFDEAHACCGWEEASC
jgi:hypothetical protein